jgi:hypothetical protein
MKIIISENQEMDVEKKFIFMLLNSMNYDLKYLDRFITFNRIGHTNEIVYSEQDNVCFVYNTLIKLIYSYTTFNFDTIKNAIVIWVENVLEKKVDILYINQY